MYATTIPMPRPWGRQFVSITLICLAFLAERPYAFFRYPAYFEQSGLFKISALILFIVAQCLLCLLLYIYAAKSTRIIKWSLFTLVAISTTTFDVYSAASNGAPLLYEDYAVLIDAMASAGDAVQEYYLLFFYSVLRLSVLGVGFAIMAPSRGASTKAIGLFLASVLIFSSICVLKRGTHTNLLPGTAGLYGLSIASIFDASNKEYVYSGAPQPAYEVADLNLVLVIDESVRADFLSKRDLDALMSQHTVGWQYNDFGAATSGGNCSAASNIMIRKGVRPEHVTADLYSNPLIWDYARQAGFTTYLIDAQREGKGHNHFDSLELRLVDHNIKTSHIAWDLEIPALMSHLQAPGKSLSLVIMRGSHFPYKRNFPPDYSIEVRSPYVAADPSRIAYKTSVSWQTKRFIDSLISLKLNKPTVVIYTSDHGQNLNDQPGPHHCTGSGIPFAGEGLVPFVLFTNFRDQALKRASAFNYNALSHFHIAPTLMQYMGFDIGSSSGTQRRRTGSIFKKTIPLNQFTYGDPFERFNRPVKFNDLTQEARLVLQRTAAANPQ